jgi:amino-acid N-acetyltransferase
MNTCQPIKPFKGFVGFAGKNKELQVKLQVRNARIADVKTIYSLISCYAERDKMLFRSISDIYENMQNFFVAEIDGIVVGCCALQIIWADLAEIKSLAVAPEQINKGAGKMLVTAIMQHARELGLPRIFALTLIPDFFEKLGFKIISMDSLPMKVWTDCAKCSKQQNCDETALIYNLVVC